MEKKQEEKDNIINHNNIDKINNNIHHLSNEREEGEITKPAPPNPNVNIFFF